MSRNISFRNGFPKSNVSFKVVRKSTYTKYTDYNKTFPVFLILYNCIGRHNDGDYNYDDDDTRMMTTMMTTATKMMITTMMKMMKMMITTMMKMMDTSMMIQG